ncbi:hypothetical protein AB3S75_010188 [Citrus x aurantiifolia]
MKISSTSFNHFGLCVMRLNSQGAKLRHGANFATGGQPLEGQTSPSLILEAVLSLLMCRLRFHQFKARSKRLYDAAKINSDRDKLPIREDFAEALYPFDIGQVDLAAGFITMSFYQLLAKLPDVIS